MKKQLVECFPKGMTVCLALMLITVVLMTGYGETHATPIKDLTPASQPLPKAKPNGSDAPGDMPTASSNQLIWVRQDSPVINIDKDPLRYEPIEDRFAGSFTQYTVNETDIAMETRHVDHGVESYNVTISSVFDRPPLVLTPPSRYKIKASFSHAGTHNYYSVGAQFMYSGEGRMVEPYWEPLGYYPWDSWWDGPSSKEWMVTAPPITQLGETFEFYAGWWNCAPCNATWTYRAEWANAVERLGVEVVQPIVRYQGDEVLPGETYFPEPCTTQTGRATASCSYKTEMEDKAEAYIKCLSDLDGHERLLVLLSLIKLGDGNDDIIMKQAIMQIAEVKLAENCGYHWGASDEYRLDLEDEYRLDLVLEQGAMLLSNVVDGQTTSVDTPLGKATAAAQGTFVTGFNPGTNVATFRAYSTPLTLQPKDGANLVLLPPQQVELTSTGFGPVAYLPHLFLPVLIK